MPKHERHLGRKLRKILEDLQTEPIVDEPNYNTPDSPDTTVPRKHDIILFIHVHHILTGTVLIDRGTRLLIEADDRLYSILVNNVIGILVKNSPPLPYEEVVRELTQDRDVTALLSQVRIRQSDRQNTQLPFSQTYGEHAKKAPQKDSGNHSNQHSPRERRDPPKNRQRKRRPPNSPHAT